MASTKAFLTVPVAILLAALLVMALGTTPSLPRFRVAVIGIDGATWRAIDPMIEHGWLPCFAALRASATTGDLLSLPPYNSPQMWTTIATGQPPEVHGIENFTAKGPDGRPVPSSSNLRRSPAVWGIASHFGRSVGVVAWYVSWPAEKVNGFVVSDHVRPMEQSAVFWPVSPEDEAHLTRRTYPEDLLGVIQRCCFMEAKDVDRQEMAEDLPIFGAKHPYLGDETAMRAGLHLYGRFAPDLFLIYQHGTDVMQHIAYGPFDQYLRGDQTQERKARRVINYYRYEDDNIGRLVLSLGGTLRLEGRDPAIELPRDVVLLIVSDHGFGPGHRPLQPALTGDHRPEGILVLAGSPFRRGARVEGATVLDVLPTILALEGIPISGELPGHDLSHVRHRTTSLPYENAPSGGDVIASPLDGEILDELRALGYIR